MPKYTRSQRAHFRNMIQVAHSKGHRTVRDVADFVGLTYATTQRYMAKMGLAPHKQRQALTIKSTVLSPEQVERLFKDYQPGVTSLFDLRHRAYDWWQADLADATLKRWMNLADEQRHLSAATGYTRRGRGTVLTRVEIEELVRLCKDDIDTISFQEFKQRVLLTISKEDKIPAQATVYKYRQQIKDLIHRRYPKEPVQ